MAGLEDHHIYAVIGIVLSAGLVLLLNKHQRDKLFAYICTSSRGRRISTSKTPPRSLSPEKKVPNNNPPSVDYKDILPPSVRETLVTTAESLSIDQKLNLKGNGIDSTVFRKSIIPFTADYRECGHSTYTPTEVSIKEVKALGDFPNYAELSGVPLPEAYEEFKIDTAIARPYRPLRWTYHQTMCMAVPFLCIDVLTDSLRSAH